jgi:purine-nucleoside phosphorylase
LLSDGIAGAELERRIEAASAAVSERLASAPHLPMPRVSLILGSGLGTVADLLDGGPTVRLPYREIPHVPGAQIEGHAGELLAGRVGDLPLIILSGRVHPYEGHSHRAATILLRAVLLAGVDTVIVTNAAGGLNPDFDPGDVMLITDHINLSGDNPLLGPNIDRLGPRFPAMTDAYDPDLREGARAAAAEAGEPVREGVYVMLSGPAYETRAEMRMLRSLGGDAVGMSTAHEVIAARHAGSRVVGFSLITNKATDDVTAGATHAEVIEIGRIGGARLVKVLGHLLPRMAP